MSQINYSFDLVLKCCNKFQDTGTEIVNVVWQSLHGPFRKWTSHAAETLNWQSIEQIASGGQLQRGVELPLGGLFTTYTNCLQPISFISKSVSSDWLQESQWVLARRFTQPTFSLEFWISWRHVLVSNRRVRQIYYLLEEVLIEFNLFSNLVCYIRLYWISWKIPHSPDFSLF